MKVEKLNASVICILVLLASQVQPNDATAFIIGGLCVGALELITNVARAPLTRMGVEQSLETVEGYCEDLMTFSPIGQLTPGIEEGIRDLIKFTGRSGANIITRLPQIAERLQSLAANINLSRN